MLVTNMNTSLSLHTGMPETEHMELTPATPLSQPDSSTPSAPPTTQPHRPVPPLPPVAASICVGVAKEKSTHPSTSGGRGPKDNKHLEHALGAFDLDDTLSPGERLCWWCECVCGH